MVGTLNQAELPALQRSELDDMIPREDHYKAGSTLNEQSFITQAPTARISHPTVTTRT